MGEPNKLYFCDPRKNTECSKTDCIINGGECFKTTKREYKLDLFPPCLYLPSEKYETCGRCIFENVDAEDEPCRDCRYNQFRVLPNYFISRDQYMELISKDLKEEEK